MTSTILLLMLMVFAGGIAAAQSAINAQLSAYLGNPIGASFLSFLVGTIVLGILLLASKQKLPGLTEIINVPPRYLLGGICGSIFITSAIYLVPKIGVVHVLFLGLAGQVIVSLAIDSFGLFDINQQSITRVKVAGLCLILAGIVVSKSGFQPAKAQPKNPVEVLYQTDNLCRKLEDFRKKRHSKILVKKLRVRKLAMSKTYQSAPKTRTYV